MGKPKREGATPPGGGDDIDASEEVIARLNEELAAAKNLLAQAETERDATKEQVNELSERIKTLTEMVEELEGIEEERDALRDQLAAAQAAARASGGAVVANLPKSARDRTLARLVEAAGGNTGPIKVRAKSPGIYGRMRETGEVFTVANRNLLGSWMELVNPDADEPADESPGERRTPRRTDESVL